MKKTILKAALASLILAIPGAVTAQIVGDCYGCHTMHNSEQNGSIAEIGGVVTGEAVPNLLKFDCVSCHANNPTGGDKIWVMSGGSEAPQVMHGGTTGDLAGGNWRYMADESSNRKGHNVIDLKTYYGNLTETGYGQLGTWAPIYEPPGLNGLGAHDNSRSAFTDTVPFDLFTCAGARGCHGTRAQVIGAIVDNGTDNLFVGNRRTGMAAISGAHHNNVGNAIAKDATNYLTPTVHDGAKVAEGYRFIVGLKGVGNDVDLWQNVDENSHNEYYATTTGIEDGTSGSGTGCYRCHVTGSGGMNSRAAYDSTIRTPNNTMSGFCVSCHGGFHSSGLSPSGDFTGNGTSGAFLRHPSDYQIPNSGEYANYTVFDVTAPVARTVLYTGGQDATVYPGGDAVMCLSCHKAHASEQDYMLHFNYSAMTAGFYGGVPAAQAEGGCLACHTTKGVLPANR